MGTMDADAIKVMIKALVQEMGVMKSGGMGRTIEEKHFKRIETFEDGVEKWKKFSSQVKIIVNSKDKILKKAMEEAEITSNSKEIDESVWYETGDYQGQNMERKASELFEVLCLVCSGEALNLIENMEHGDGVKAWHHLCKKYNSDTMAGTLRKILHKRSNITAHASILITTPPSIYKDCIHEVIFSTILVIKLGFSSRSFFNILLKSFCFFSISFSILTVTASM